MDYTKGKFSVVIGTYNNAKLIRDLVYRLLEEKLIGEIIIIDDGSKDNTLENLEHIKQKYVGSIKIKIICNRKNTGVIAPRNQGLKLAACEYTMILDDDQIPGCCTFRRYKEAFKKVDIVGYIPGMINPQVGAVVVDIGEQFNHIGEGSMCMSTSLWKELNYFDTAFSPAYREGPDIQLRAIQKGKTIGCVENSEIVHIGNKTLGRKDIGFDLNAAGYKSHKLIMDRIKLGLYGRSYEVMGKYFKPK